MPGGVTRRTKNKTNLQHFRNNIPPPSPLRHHPGISESRFGAGIMILSLVLWFSAHRDNIQYALYKCITITINLCNRFFLNNIFGFAICSLVRTWTYSIRIRVTYLFLILQNVSLSSIVKFTVDKI